MALELLDVEQDPAPLHRRKHRQQGHFNLLVDAAEGGFGLEPRPEPLMHAQGDVGILRGVLAGRLHRHFREGNLARALAGDLFVADGAVGKLALGQAIEIVAAASGVEDVAFEHRVMSDAAQRNPVMGEHVQVVFEVLPYFRPVRVLEQGLEARERLGEGS